MLLHSPLNKPYNDIIINLDYNQKIPTYGAWMGTVLAIIGSGLILSTNFNPNSTNLSLSTEMLEHSSSDPLPVDS